MNNRTQKAPAFYGFCTALIRLSPVVVLLLLPGLPLFPLMWLSQTL
jgi:hypothetical protein